MKQFLKIVGYVLLGLLGLLIALGIILPKHIDVALSKDVNVEPQYIYNVLADPSMTTSYNAWTQQAEDMVVTTTQGRGLGSGYSWTTAEGGTGRSEITEAIPSQRIGMSIYQGDSEEPMVTTYDIDPSANGKASTIQFNWHADLGFPKNIMGPLWSYMGKKSFVKTLDNVGDIARKRSEEGVYNGYKIVQSDVAETHYIANRDKVAMAAVQQYYSQALSSVFRTLQDSEVQAIGPDCALIYSYDTDRTQIDIAAALPVAEDMSLPNTSTIVLPQAEAVTTEFYGNRIESAPAHTAITDYLADRGLLPQKPYVEEYVTDVLQEKDPNKWLTRITYRLAGE